MSVQSGIGAIAPNKPLQAIKFLYEDIDYWNVIQDAETMICSLKEQGNLMLNKGLYRYKDFMTEYGEYVQLTEEEKKLDLKAGNFIWRDGEPLMISKCDGVFRIDEIPYERDWTTKRSED